MRTIQRFLYQRRFVLLVALVMGAASTVFAQPMDPLTDPILNPLNPTRNATEQKIVEVILKIVLPFLWTIVSPMLAGLIVAGVKVLPPGMQYVLSSMIGAGFGGLAGMIPDFPYTIESAAEVGGSTSLAAQFWANRNPSVSHPKLITEEKKT